MTRSHPIYSVVNPVNGIVAETFETLTSEGLGAVLDAADAAFRQWRATPVAERAAALLGVAEQFRSRADELAAAVTEETGKPLEQAKAEVLLSVTILDYYGTAAPRLAAPTPIDSSSGEAVIEKSPLGTILGIAPWNFPVYQAFRFAIPNLAAGNAVLLKPAESCPRSALIMQEIFDGSDLPDGVYGTVLVDHEQIAAIIADSRVRGVSLTGSERAGAAVASLAGQHLKKVVLELGGSDPYIVLDSDDVAAAATQAWTVRMTNMGQICNSNKRMIVMHDIYDEFVAEIAALAAAMRQGDPTAPGASDAAFFPLASRAGAERVAQQVRQAVDEGASLLAGGELVDETSGYLRPAVLTDVTPDMAAYAEEIFGPVAVVFQARDVDHAIELANDSPFGLGAAVFSADAERAAQVAGALESGMVTINVPTAFGPELPFGGIKQSGFGRELGPEGMDEFVNKRLVFTAR